MITEVNMFEYKEPRYIDVSCFLAGGINNTKDWQREVIDELKRLDVDGEEKEFIVYNPREVSKGYDKEFGPKDYVKWDDENLKRATIVSFYFTSEAIQATSLFELGRYISNIGYEDRLFSFAFKYVISFEEGYPHAEKVKEYLKLIFMEKFYDIAVCEHATPIEHARRIYRRYLEFRS